MQRIAIYGREVDERHIAGLNHMFEKLNAAGIETHIFEEFSDILQKTAGINPIDHKTFLKPDFQKIDVDVFFSIGGDGTILEAATFVGELETPILGINTGRLGFLSSVTLDHFDEALEQMINGTVINDYRSVLKVESDEELFGKENFALNELTIHKKDTQSMISIHAYIDGKYLNTYWADGLIISTPTGSTAYSLSCGGPITLPSSKNLIITPVSPHNLNVRPVLISDQSVITLRVEGRSDQYLVSLDSRTTSVPHETVITVMKNTFSVNLLRLKNHSFLKTLRTKLHWGIDQRN